MGNAGPEGVLQTAVKGVWRMRTFLLGRKQALKIL